MAEKSMKNSFFGLKLFSVFALAGVLAATASAQYKLEASSAPVPQDLSASMRGDFEGTAMQVTGASGPFCEIWLRKSIPAAPTPDTSLGVNFGQIPQGALVGAIKFDAQGADYRNQPIKPGVYTLRFMLEPVNGDHQGVSPYRDFLLAVPAALDTSDATISTDDLLKLSRKASGTGHPSVWSLVPADNAPATLPAIAHQQEDTDLWIVFFQAPLATPVKMGLAVVGHAAEPE
jgi:hypothetical protein